MFPRIVPKPRPPGPSVKSELQACFQQFTDHMELLNRHWDQSNLPLRNVDPLSRKGYPVLRDGFLHHALESKGASTEAQKANGFVLQAQSIWPEGKNAFTEPLDGINCVTSLIANLQEANSLAADDDRLHPTKMKRVRQLLRANRAHGSSADKHFEKGFALLTQSGALD